MRSRVEERCGRFRSVFCLCEGLLSISAVFRACWIDVGKRRDLASENSTNHSAVAGVNSRDGVCSAHVRTISDLVPCVGHFNVRGAGHSVVEPFSKLGVQKRDNVTKSWSPRSKAEGTPKVE